MNIFQRFSSRLLPVTGMLLLMTGFIAAAGEVDPTFGGGAFEQPNRNVHVIKRQNDGKILIAGTFEVVNGKVQYLISRLNPDSTVDTTFNPPSYLQGIVRAIAIQADGKILIGGNFLVPYFTGWTYVVRLNTDGSFDNTFTSITTDQDASGAANAVRDLEVLADGRVLIAGTFSYASGGTRTKIARLNTDGTTDTTFNPVGLLTEIKDFEIQSDGKIVGVTTDGGANNRFIKRFNTDGTEDLSFNALVTGSVNALKLQADGKVLIAGEFTFVNNIARVDAARLNTDGSLDNSFTVTTGIIGPPVPSYLTEVEIEAGGTILLGGYFSKFNGIQKTNLVRVDTNGNLDDTFIGPSLMPRETVSAMLPLSNGQIMLSAGDPPLYGANDRVYRLHANGIKDSYFSGLVGSRGLVTDILVQPDGKVLVAGIFGAINTFERLHFARFNADGSPDTTFSPLHDTAWNTPYVHSIALQPDGKILVGGERPYSKPLRRLHQDGWEDSTFNAAFLTSGRVLDIVVQPDGKVLAVGKRSDLLHEAWRFNADGSKDATFSTAFNGEARRIVLQPDGKILVAGAFSSVNGTPRGRVARLNSNGSLDETFNPLGGANNPVNDIGLQPDGKIVIAGEFLSYNGTARAYITRLGADGNLDPAFGAATNNLVRAIKVEASGKIILGGEFTAVSGTAREKIARINADGTTDTTFNVGTGVGINTAVYALALQADNKVFVGGNFTYYNQSPHVAIVRLLNAPARTLFDFDGDGRSDVAVFRPSSGDWYQLLSGSGSYNVFHFGQSGDRLAPADYDGDGRSDVSVFRDSVPGGGNTAYFYVTNSGNGSITAAQFGSTGDVPLSGDWDGDGKADLAVYRDGSASGGQSTFYYRPSGSPAVNFNAIPWGTTGDKPLAGDFDGDGKLDAAVFRPSTATWYILNSANGQVVQQTFGLSTDIPAAADFDGDGKTNIAVFRPSTGYWYTSMDPLTNYGGVGFGTAGDVPVAADYDGDGRADVAVFRPSNGLWYILRSTQGFTAVNFGTSGDKPIPSAFVP